MFFILIIKASASSLGSLDFIGELLDEVLVDDIVRGSEEGEDMGDQVAFVDFVVPVVEVFAEDPLLGGPEEGGFGTHVYLQDLWRMIRMVVRMGACLGGEEDEA
jgi:hypothetical protein